MVSRQSMGWHFGTSCFPTASPVGLASIGDLCLNHLLHWCLKNGYFLLLFLHLLAGILSSFPFHSLPPFFVFCCCCCWTMDSCIHVYLRCYNQWVILSGVQIDYLLCLFDMSPSFIMCFLLCDTARCPGLTCIFPSLALDSAVSRSLVSFGGSGI